MSVTHDLLQLLDVESLAKGLDASSRISRKTILKWRDRIKDTWVVQPGQFGVRLSHVIIDLGTMEMEKHGHGSHMERLDYNKD